MATPASNGRVAVIVVHGIADQARGETAATVATQLGLGLRAGVTRFDVPISVASVEPATMYRRWHPKRWGGRMWKSLRQSFRSDFLDPQLGAQPASRKESPPAPLPNSACPLPSPTTQREQQPVDHGIRFTDYLLAKAHAGRDEKPDSTFYVAPRFDVHAASGAKADVFEMHWADLSRLPGTVARIFTELFTLMFHLSKLGADTVALAALAGPGGPALKTLSVAQRLAHWLFSRMLALVSLQLVFCLLLLLPRAVVKGHEITALAALAALLGVGIAAWRVYRGARWISAFWFSLVPGVVIAVAIARYVNVFPRSSGLPATAWLMAAWLVTLLVLYERFLRFAEDRFRAVLGIGRLLMLVTLSCVVLGAADGLHTWNGWAQGTLSAMEAALLINVLVWVAMAVVVAIAVVAGECAGHGTASTASALRQSVVTAHLGLFASMAAFLAFVMSAWALIAAPLKELVFDMNYRAWWFVSDGAGAGNFMEDRFVHSTESFAVLTLMLFALVGFVSIVFLPSIGVELRAVRGMAAGRLGAWLTTGYRTVERFVRWWGWVLMLLIVFAACVLVDSQLVRLARHPVLGSWLGDVHLLPPAWRAAAEAAQQGLSGQVLASLVIAVSGGTVGLIAIGRVAFKRLQALRAPLDAVLDVDNHFREFPRTAIPRVRIIERYVALLRHILDQHYDKLVIVSHSQGTVITAELLRYLQQRHRLLARPAAEQDDTLVRMAGELRQADVQLITAGSPLRQLYALRFPFLYPWVLQKRPGGLLGPMPADLGVRRWINLWGCGDYVGRWLWAPATDQQPAALDVHPSAYVRVGHDDTASHDSCIGVDAHTHYFEPDQATVIARLKQAVLAPRVPAVPPDKVVMDETGMAEETG